MTFGTSWTAGVNGRRGLFISLEGGDFSGKSTQVPLLVSWLREVRGGEVVATREPGATPLGAELRRLVQHGEAMSPWVEAMLYATDRAHHVATVVRPALERGACVVTDRYLDSSVAYQAGGRELPAAEVERLSLWAVGGLLPDVTVLLDIDETTAAERRAARMVHDGGGLDRLESAGDNFHARVRAAYRERAAADPGRFLVVDASASVDEVHDRVRAALTPRLGLSVGRVADAVRVSRPRTVPGLDTPPSAALDRRNNTAKEAT